MGSPVAESLSYEVLESAVRGEGAALRWRTRLQPAGGAGDKVFPPTYKDAKYAEERRRIEGRDEECVLLDSVASQANRMELALLRALRAGEIELPTIDVAFPEAVELSDLGIVSVLEAPHRVFDAILRDSLAADGRPFRYSAQAADLNAASSRNATSLLELCPSALVFGAWDSTGPRGGLGAKFARALVSEVVAVGARTGVSVGSRIDPLGIQKLKDADRIFQHPDREEGWTMDPGTALKDPKGKPVLNKKEGKPSEINHGNVTPDVAAHGGVTFDYALQTAVLSLPALRRLEFRTAAGHPPEAQVAARTWLAALAVAAVALARRDGFDFRSRCALVPEGPTSLELIDADSGAARPFVADVATARKLLGEATTRARQAGFVLEPQPLVLRPSPKFVTLLVKSREAAQEDTGGGE